MSKQRRAPSTRTPQTDDALETLVTDDELTARGFGDRSTRYRQVQKGQFPAPIQLSSGCKRWRWSTIVAWLKEREAHPAQARPYYEVWKLPRKAKASTDAEGAR
jgi:predicted DNA-binding transcriptional regulator AlpA